MTNVISRLELLEKIIAVSKELFQKNLASNPQEFSFDEERLDRRFCIRTKEFRCHIHRYEGKNSYYGIWFDCFYNMVPGYDRGFLVVHNAFVTASFYIDDGDYYRTEDYDDEKLKECFSLIYSVLSGLIN